MDALSGSLEHFMPLQILRLLQSTAATGRLEVVHEGERAEFFIREGRSTFARTSGVHVRVGDVLVDAGDIRPEAIELTAAVQQDQPGTRIGQMLLDSGVVEPHRLHAAVLEVQRRIVYRVLLWRKGQFRFHPGERTGDEDITLDLDLDRLIIDALRVAGQSGGSHSEDLAA